MAASTWNLVFFVFLLPFDVSTAIAVEYEEDGPLYFSCPGISNIVQLEYWKDIHTVCGPEFMLMYNGSHTSLLDGKLMFHFSSFPNTDFAVPLHHTTYDLDHVYHEWSLKSQLSIDNSDIPCGAGYIIAAIHQYGMIKNAAAQRAVRVCDFSDIDLELEVSANLPNHTIRLAADGSRLVDQLKHQNIVVDKILVHNHGNRRLDNVTMENPQMVMFFLRHHGSMETITPMCDVPSFSLDDSAIGVFMFTEGIDAYGMREAIEHPSMTVNVQFRMGINVCGDAELVIMLDPLGMLNDSNPCNNFVKMNVYVDCADQSDTCDVVPNLSLSGREAYLMFQEMYMPETRMYKYLVDDKKWNSIDAHKADSQAEQVGIGKFVVMNKLIPWVYETYNNGHFPCKSTWPLIKRHTRFHAMYGHSNYTLDMSRMSTLNNLKMRMKTMNPMNSFDDLKLEIEMFGNNTYDVQDEVMRMKIQGLSYGLQHVMGMKYLIEMMKMLGREVPRNVTRTTLGPVFEGLAGLLWHAHEMSPTMHNYMLPTIMQHTATAFMFIDNDLFEIPHDIRENAYNMLHNILNYPEEIFNKGKNDSMCAEGHVARMAKYMWYLSMGHDGQHETLLDHSICEQLMVTSYMAHGGAHIIAKDILADVADDLNNDMPKECKPHPYVPNDNPKAMWRVDDGKVMMGHYSPLENVVTWKVVAVCRCDGCPGIGRNPMYGSTTPSMTHSRMTTD